MVGQAVFRALRCASYFITKDCSVNMSVVADNLGVAHQAQAMAVESQPRCVVCGHDGAIRYDDLSDRIFGAPGRWRIRACGNPGCGSLWLDPRPTLAEIHKAYSTYYTHESAAEESLRKRLVRLLTQARAEVVYARGKGHLPWPLSPVLCALAGWYPGLNEHLDLMIRYMKPPQTPSLLLDVGCGDGEALALLKTIGWNVMGLEFDPKAAQAARARGIEVREGDLAAASFPEATFDAVTSSHVIEHVYEPLEFLRESRRVLKASGTVIAVTPNADGWTHFRYGRDWRGLEPPRHLCIFTERALAALAESAGFSRVTVHTTARSVALLEVSSRALRDNDRYVSGSNPGTAENLLSLFNQWRASSGLRAGRLIGDELVLLATK
jgi:SAM-dependent methyltransferase